ncbi:MAG: hypothetical protein ABEJ59_05300 [Halanaeroarchaeum sp.]
MLEFDGLGAFSPFARVATTFALVGVVLVLAGGIVSSPIPRGVGPATLLGLLVAGTGSGLVVAAAMLFVVTGDITERGPN